MRHRNINLWTDFERGNKAFDIRFKTFRRSFIVDLRVVILRVLKLDRDVSEQHVTSVFRVDFDLDQEMTFLELQLPRV